MAQDMLHEENRRSWNAVVDAHNSHRVDQVAFFRAGGSTLFPEERALLGDIAGAAIVHLMCNTGQDTLSLARLGAIATGVDISDAAVATAQRLAAETGIAATFVRADVDDWLAATARGLARFDVVYCSYGAICWLSDLTVWARGVAAALHPGGRFVAVDFHPVAAMFDRDWQHAHAYYAAGAPLTSTNGVEDYVGASGETLTPGGFAEGIRDFANPHACHLFRWGLGEIVTALAEAGLTITALQEYPYVNGEWLFARMRQLPGRRLTTPDGVPHVPLMYGIAARKPTDPRAERACLVRAAIPQREDLPAGAEDAVGQG